MLILTRKSGQRILIGPSDAVDPNMTVGELFANGPIEIHYLGASRNKVPRIGIDAPKELKVMRSELAIRSEPL